MENFSRVTFSVVVNQNWNFGFVSSGIASAARPGTGEEPIDSPKTMVSNYLSANGGPVPPPVPKASQRARLGTPQASYIQ
jgi:hypothetical protein